MKIPRRSHPPNIDTSPTQNPHGVPRGVGERQKPRTGGHPGTSGQTPSARFSRVNGATDPADFVINYILDLEADGQLHEAQAQLAEAAARDPQLVERLNETQRVLSMLRCDHTESAGEHRDLTDAIIERVEKRRVFLPRPSRRRVGGRRLAFAGAGVAVLSVIGLLQLRTPEASRSDRPVASESASVVTTGVPNLLSEVGTRVGDGIGTAADALAGHTYTSLTKQLLEKDLVLEGQGASSRLELTFADARLAAPDGCTTCSSQGWDRVADWARWGRHGQPGQAYRALALTGPAAVQVPGALSYPLTSGANTGALGRGGIQLHRGGTVQSPAGVRAVEPSARISSSVTSGARSPSATRQTSAIVYSLDGVSPVLPEWRWLFDQEE